MIIAIGGQKGGAGKSTLTASLAVALQDRELDVLLIDADEQGTLATWHYTGCQSGEVLPPLIQAQGAQLLEQLNALSSDPRITLVDLDGRNSENQRIALACADLFLMPVRTGGPDVWALSKMISLVKEVQQPKLNPGLQARIVLNAQQGTVLTRSLRNMLIEGAYLPMMDTELTQLVAFQEAIVAGSGPTRATPHDKAAKQLRQLVREIDEVMGGALFAAAPPVAVSKKKRSA